MTLSKLAPLSLAVAIAVSLSACGKPENPAGSAGAAGQAPKLDLSRIDAPSVAFDVTDLDPSVSACSDLNGFVNSKWLKANPVPADRTSWGSFEVLGERSLAIQRALVERAAAATTADPIEAKLGALWRSGMDEAAIDQAGLAPLQPQLQAIDALEDGAAIAAWLRDSYAKGQGFLFSFGGNADYKDSGQVIAYAGQGGLGLPEKGYYLDADKAGIRDAYAGYIARLLELSGATTADAAAQAKAVLEFETRLAKASLSRIELRDPAKRYHPVSAAEANRITPHFDWNAFFDALKVPAAGKFSLSQPGFFAELDRMLADTPADTWKAYLRFHALDEAAPYLAKPFEQANFEFYGKALRGQQEMLPRWKRTLQAVNDAMGEALGQLYVQAAFPPESKVEMQHLVQNLSTALKARLEKLDWMSEATRQRALEKWASFTPKIGYPDKWRDWSGLQVGEGYLANMQAARAFNYRWRLDKIGKPVDRTEWGMTPQTVNAYYNATKNEIVFPAAILQPPFFDAKADPALNYGGIGAVIGHEMMHGYDDSGSQFDAKGNFDSWWTDEDRKRFEQRADQLVAQFDGYEAIPGVHVKGRLTLGENIGDLGGLTVAYDALQVALKENPEADKPIDGYSQDQRFFMNWATVWRRNFTDGELRVRLNTDPHAPANFRAIAAPSNMPAYAAAFQCKAGDPMVRAGKDRVAIW
ncbi:MULTISPECIES: M13 family metallopeptidase [Gammaproteobacteria]|uniref:Peptidase n=1 Tax=Xanthomonas boreopolis TaxID=86183 RepID=A0A919KGW1_9XANT|nr:M13 family metallopeptidase [Pseudomonas sp. Hp2]GHH48351.1 peptidase [[Pseudomonas] boreopolis]